MTCPARWRRWGGAHLGDACWEASCHRPLSAFQLLCPPVFVSKQQGQLQRTVQTDWITNSICWCSACQRFHGSLLSGVGAPCCVSSNPLKPSSSSWHQFILMLIGNIESWILNDLEAYKTSMNTNAFKGLGNNPKSRHWEIAKRIFHLSGHNMHSTTKSSGMKPKNIMSSDPRDEM